MQPNLVAVLICSLFLSPGTAEPNAKPTFTPYCLRLHICASACKCRFGPRCELIQMDDSTRNELLLYHNKVRHEQTKTKNPPAGLALLEYDMDLEEVSSCWAARCSNDYSDCFCTPNFPEVSHSIGQIIVEGAETPRVELWLELMDSWISVLNEVPIGDINTATESKQDIVEHNIAQIMSDQILYVGCAWSKSNNWVTCVCSYGPRGPLRGDLIYKSGEVCSICPEGYACYAVKPFEELCKSVEYKEMQDSERKNELTEMDVIRKMRGKRRQIHRKTPTPTPKDGNDGFINEDTKFSISRKTSKIVGLCTLGALVIFFVLVGLYVWVTAKFAPRNTNQNCN